MMKDYQQNLVFAPDNNAIKLFSVDLLDFIAGGPKAALLFWFFGGFRCGVPLFIVMLVIY